MALFSAWARLQMASTEQQYLTNVVQPYLAMLTPLWLSSLKEFARLRFEPDISGSLGTSPQSGNLDEVYAALNRETLLKVKDVIMLRYYLSILMPPRSSTKIRGYISSTPLLALLKRTVILSLTHLTANSTNQNMGRQRNREMALSMATTTVGDMTSTTVMSLLPSFSSSMVWRLKLLLTSPFLRPNGWRFSRLSRGSCDQWFLGMRCIRMPSSRRPWTLWTALF